MHDSQRGLILLTTSISSFITPFLSSAVAFSVPSIGDFFRLTFYQIAILPVVLLIPLSSFMILFGRISDDFGRVKIFRYGLLIFSLSSLIAGLSQGYYELVVVVFVIGIGSAILGTNSTAIVSYVFPEGSRGFALGINAMSVYLGLTFAPFLGGLLIEFLKWQAIFFFVTPLGILGLIISLISMRGIEIKSKRESSNFIGAALFSGFIISLTSYIALWDMLGYLNILYLPVISLVFFVLFVRYERTSSNPVIPRNLLRGNRTFVASNITAFLNYVSTFSIVFVFSLYLQVVLHVSPFLSGLLLLPEPVFMVALSPIAGKLSDTFGSRFIASLGMLIIGMSFIVMYFLYPIDKIQLMIMLGIIGTGFGFFSAPNTNSVMGAAERKFSGIAAGFLGTMRFTGQLISISIATVMFSLFLPKTLVVGMFSGTIVSISLSSFDGFIHGLRIIMLISGILSLIGAGTSIMRNSGK